MVEKKRKKKKRGGRKESCWKFLKKEREDLAFYKK